MTTDTGSIAITESPTAFYPGQEVLVQDLPGEVLYVHADGLVTVLIPTHEPGGWRRRSVQLAAVHLTPLGPRR